MKNIIKYYYNLSVIDLIKKDDYYTFKINKYKYKFLIFDGDFEKLIFIYKILLENNKYCHEIVLNKDNSIITFYNGKNYILIKYNISIKNIVNIYDIVEYDIKLNIEYACNWKKLWGEKIDYYEYQISEFGLNYPKIRDSLSYYIGLGETAISLLNYLNKEYGNIDAYISHNRILFNEGLEEFFNPINIIIDNRSRDIAEYIKINYINDNLSIQDVVGYIKKLNCNYNEIILFFARLLYPSYYFDMYDRIIKNEINEKEIDYYTKKNISYEIFLKQIYKFLFYNYNLPEIEWLIN